MIIDSTLNQLLEYKLKKLNKLRPIHPEMIIKLKEKFEVDMTYNTNAIEGNTLTLKETYWVIQHGITVKGKSLNEHLEAKNHKEALDFLYELIEKGSRNTFSEHVIKSFHILVIQSINRKIAGQYRDIDVYISGSDHRPPSALNVPMEMQKFSRWLQINHKKMNVVEFAAIAHHKFVHIHPFTDGNGRTGRLLMNIFLMKHGFPLVVIQNNDREKYYRALKSADQENYKPLVQLVAQATLRSLNIYLDVLTPAKDKDPFISLAEAAEPYNYSQAYLSKLAKEGKIDAHKEKRNWLTTKGAIQRYIESVEGRKNKK